MKSLPNIDVRKGVKVSLEGLPLKHFLVFATVLLLLLWGCNESKPSRPKRGGRKSSKRSGKKKKKKPSSALEELRQENPNLARSVEKRLSDLATGGKKEMEIFKWFVDTGAPLVPIMLEMLRSKKLLYRVGAAYVLGKIDDPRTVAGLCMALKDSNVEVQRMACRSLSLKKDPESLSALLDALKDKDEMVRLLSAQALGEIGDIRAFDPLVAALSDQSVKVRATALFSMSQIDGPKSFEHLEAALAHNDENIRDIAILALGTIKTPEATSVLLDFLKSKGASEAEKRHILRAVSEAGTVVVPQLIALLEDDDETIQEYAAHALGEIKDARAVQPLIRVLKSTGHSWASSALAEIGKPAIRPLIELLKNLKKSDMRLPMRARSALTRITKKDFGFSYDKWSEWYEFK
jgi:HEAT repeat protein